MNPPSTPRSTAYQENPRGPRLREKVTLDSSMCHVWSDIVVRGSGGTAVLRTRQLVKDARPVSVLVYNGEKNTNHAQSSKKRKTKKLKARKQ